MSRQLVKMWRNNRGGKWDCRIKWYEGDFDDIRVQMEDCERVDNLITNDRKKADNAWAMFKQGAPESGTNLPFVADLMIMLGE